MAWSDAARAAAGRGFRLTSEAGHRQAGLKMVSDAKKWARRHVRRGD